MDVRAVLRHVPTSVVVVTGLVGGRPAGVALGSFTSVSLEPALVAFCVAHSSTTWPVLRRAPHLAVSVLGAGQEEVCRRFATPGAERFAGLATRPGPGGAPILDGAVAWLSGTVDAVHPAGDHDLVLLAVTGLGAEAPGAPLVFHGGRLHGLGAAA